MNYGAVESLFSELHGIHPDRRIAFKARLKHLQRLGFPPGVNTGTGRSAEYGAAQVYLLAIGLELLQLGLSPERAVRVATESADWLRRVGRDAAEALARGEEYYLGLDPSGLNSLTSLGDDPATWTMSAGGFSIAAGAGSALVSGRRVALLDVATLLRELKIALGAQAAEAFVADFEAWTSDASE